MRPSTTIPSRNDGVTICCPVCQLPFLPVGRQRVCSAACRQAAYRRRQATAVQSLNVPVHRSRRDGTIYQCPACEARYLGTQRCPECGTFCQRIGPGGMCPECGEPVAIAELMDGQGGRS